MRFLPGSNAEPEIRPHAPVKIADDRMDDESSHALCTTLREEDEEKVRLAEIRRGDITVHDQRVVHGSGPNESDGWRRAYVLAFRTSGDGGGGATPGVQSLAQRHIQLGRVSRVAEGRLIHIVKHRGRFPLCRQWMRHGGCIPCIKRMRPFFAMRIKSYTSPLRQGGGEVNTADRVSAPRRSCYNSSRGTPAKKRNQPN